MDVADPNLPQTRKVEFDLAAIRNELITIANGWVHNFKGISYDEYWNIYDEGIAIGWTYETYSLEQTLIRNFKNAEITKILLSSKFSCAICENNATVIIKNQTYTSLCDSCHKWISGQPTYTKLNHKIIFETPAFLLRQYGFHTYRGHITDMPQSRNLRKSSLHKCNFCFQNGEFTIDLENRMVHCCGKCIRFKLEVKSRIDLKCIYLLSILQQCDIVRIVYQTLCDLVEGREIMFKV